MRRIALIDEDAYTSAIQPFEFSASEKQPGGHAWARRLVERYLATQKQDSLVAQITKLEAEKAELKQKLDRAEWFIGAQGYRRCDIAACNCPYWHGGNASDRLQEIKGALQDADCKWEGTILKTLQKALTPSPLYEAAPRMREALKKCAEQMDLIFYTFRKDKPFMDALNEAYEIITDIAAATGKND